MQGPVDPVDKVDFTGVRWGSVEWTNLCMLYLRACESRSPDSILGDDFAARDVERIDYDFARIHRRLRPEVNKYGVALRSARLDGWITDYLDRHPDAVVLHLGCGLHSRAFRVAAQRTVRWFDVDMPQVIALRRRLYSESDGYRMIGSSVTDAGWLDELPTGGQALVVAEGLLMYLTPTEVAALLRRLVDRFDSGELQADLLSRWGPRLSKILTSGIIRWGTRAGAEVARWEPRLRLVEDSSVIAGFDEIPLARLRMLYRLQYAVPAARNYDRLFRFEF